ncbi:hypothetical protein D6856_03430 [Butyrivibrio sp. XB500-5]|uniref:hypothetical protein n=1 Tax=Butyrivibrio sp. XB500-5 TaxID=2364880 RepID=UPI000EAA62BD|nr:hypothetical protein [Butyrivibrio sp. XB500-5]RKM63190.1 hypothetical protein D6856_03430 [Butyrivibrio sp. XB500-5]
MKSKSRSASSVGSASILLIFTVLCLISFATLTIVNSRADYNLSNDLAKRQLSYYEACHKGNAFVAAVSSGYDSEGDKEIHQESIPINDSQSLDITIMSNSSKKTFNSNNSCSIIQWQIVNHDDSEYDYTLPVAE